MQRPDRITIIKYPEKNNDWRGRIILVVVVLALLAYVLGTNYYAFTRFQEQRRAVPSRRP